MRDKFVELLDNLGSQGLMNQRHSEVSDFDLLEVLSLPARQALNCYDGGVSKGRKFLDPVKCFRALHHFHVFHQESIATVLEGVKCFFPPYSVILMGQ